MDCKNCLKYTNCCFADLNYAVICEKFKPDNLPELNEWLDYNRSIIGDTAER